jgi:hypothetical protein
MNLLIMMRRSLNGEMSTNLGVRPKGFPKLVIEPKYALFRYKTPLLLAAKILTIHAG